MPKPKPIVIAKRQGFDWMVSYIENKTNEPSTMSVLGSPTIDDALREAHLSLSANHQDWYTITRIEIVEEVDNDRV